MVHAGKDTTNTRQCEACGTTQNLGSLGGVLLCRAHMADIQAGVEALRADGKQVNVMGIARRMYRETNGANTYLLRDIPDNLTVSAKRRALEQGISLRELILDALRAYLDIWEAAN